MFSTIIFLILCAIEVTQSVPLLTESCTADILNSSFPCWSGIVSSRFCKSAFLNLGNTEYKSCSTVGFGWWSGSTNNLTLTIETSFTQQRQSYLIQLNNQQLKEFKDYSVRFFRILNNEETELISTDDIITQYSDSNYQIILKFQGPTTYNLLPIIYEVFQSE